MSSVYALDGLDVLAGALAMVRFAQRESRAALFVTCSGGKPPGPKLPGGKSPYTSDCFQEKGPLVDNACIGWTVTILPFAEECAWVRFVSLLGNVRAT